MISFRNDYENNIHDLYRQLRQRTLDVGQYRFFHVYDPKKRLICAAAFPERVLHHAIMNVCEPVLDRYAIMDSYACRKGKGTHRAILRTQSFARRRGWFLKLDIRKYFDSIDHKILHRLLSRRFKDGAVLDLFGQILKTYQTQKGKGLPIGNLVSQHLANFYLSFFDHWIKEDRQIRLYLRYMDDFLVFGKDKQELKEELQHIHTFLDQKLALSLNPAIQLNRCSRGIPFLGYRVFPRKRLLSQRSKRRFINKFRLYEGKWLNGQWPLESLTRHMEALIEFTRMADAKGFRNNVIERFGVLS